MVYSWFRKTYFQQTPEEGFDNALDIIDLQRVLGIPVTRVELPMQEWVLERGSLIDFFNFYYQKFKPALYLSAIACLILAPTDFRRIWRMFMIATLIAVPWYAIYPLAPPRFMEPFGYPFVDTLAVYAGVQSSAAGAGGANQFAAMPSMHIGWSTFAALWLVAALPRWRIGTVLGGLHLALMCVTVIVTGNHYVLDIVGGFIVAGTAIAVGRFLSPERVGRWWQERWRGRRGARGYMTSAPTRPSSDSS
ncbi:MAG TPA: phosphatase PAP2 family protein [Thermomicrobiales bacterium]|nr:phosphatase PAP2 family protein [Thermomicrobiales bacterium]